MSKNGNKLTLGATQSIMIKWLIKMFIDFNNYFQSNLKKFEFTSLNLKKINLIFLL